MKRNDKNSKKPQQKASELSSQETEQVACGRQVYLDGMLVEMSDAGIPALINTGAVRQITAHCC